MNLILLVRIQVDGNFHYLLWMAILETTQSMSRNEIESRICICV